MNGQAVRAAARERLVEGPRVAQAREDVPQRVVAQPPHERPVAARVPADERAEERERDEPGGGPLGERVRVVDVGGDDHAEGVQPRRERAGQGAPQRVAHERDEADRHVEEVGEPQAAVLERDERAEDGRVGDPREGEDQPPVVHQRRRHNGRRVVPIGTRRVPRGRDRPPPLRCRRAAPRQCPRGTRRVGATARPRRRAGAARRPRRGPPARPDRRRRRPRSVRARVPVRRPARDRLDRGRAGDRAARPRRGGGGDRRARHRPRRRHRGPRRRASRAAAPARRGGRRASPSPSAASASGWRRPGSRSRARSSAARPRRRPRRPRSSAIPVVVEVPDRSGERAVGLVPDAATIAAVAADALAESRGRLLPRRGARRRGGC